MFPQKLDLQSKFQLQLKYLVQLFEHSKHQLAIPNNLIVGSSRGGSKTEEKNVIVFHWNYTGSYITVNQTSPITTPYKSYRYFSYEAPEPVQVIMRQKPVK